MHTKKQHFLDIVGNEPKNLDELGNSIIKFLNKNKFQKRFSDDFYNGVNVVGMKWDIRYNNQVRNSHDAPLSGVTNFDDRNKDAPTSYPGFSGRIWIRYENELDIWESDTIRDALTYPGTGGGGAYGGPWARISSLYYSRFGNKEVGGKPKFIRPQIVSWDYRFYLDDWPLIQKYIEHHQTFQQLQSKKFELHHVFEWYDEKTIQRDKELEEYIIKYTGRT